MPSFPGSKTEKKRMMINNQWFSRGPYGQDIVPSLFHVLFYITHTTACPRCSYYSTFTHEETRFREVDAGSILDKVDPEVLVLNHRSATHCLLYEKSRTRSSN